MQKQFEEMKNKPLLVVLRGPESNSAFYIVK